MEEVILTEKDVPGAYLSRDPSEYRLPELKRWLACHGQKTTVKLPEAIENVRACIALKIQVVPGIDDGKWYELKKKGISTSATSSVPTASAPNNGWTTFPTVDIPDMFNYGCVYHYLIESIAQFGQENHSNSSEEGSDTENSYAATEKPLRKGRKLLESEFIEDAQDNSTETHYFLRAHVQHSMKNEYPLDVMVALSKLSGFIVKASCNCKASALSRCAHVAALLLNLEEYTKKNGHRVITPSTSKPCVWNRGKKRAKNPKPLHEAEYKSKRFNDGRMYKWDPRPKELRGNLTKQQINDFVRDLQTVSAATNHESMWETSLFISYDNYNLEDDRKQILLQLTRQLEESLTPADSVATKVSDHGAYEISGTKEQSKSTIWFRERHYRITASKCKEICLLGDKVVENKIENQRKFFNWLLKNIWSPTFVQTIDMQYGLSEEPKAREAYTKATGNVVREAGLLVNTKFPYLGASPDGLAKESTNNVKSVGVEIKCLKILKDKSVEELVQQHHDGKIQGELLSRQCFKFVDSKLKLRHSHSYYYQVQLLLLVSDLDFWDFVLHSPKGPPSIERIPRDEELLSRMRHSLSAFWHKVLAPDLFEMRVPRRLLPFVL